LVEYLFNELSAGISKQQAGYEVSKSRLTWLEAVEYWKAGSGADLRVPLASIDLSQVTAADFPGGVGSERVIDLSSKSGTNLNDRIVYGNITLRLVGPNLVEAAFDRFNFDIKDWNSDTWKRNVATIAGAWTRAATAGLQSPGAAPGGSNFFIQLDGRAKIGR
jgi:hypothetical protein